MRYRRSAGRVSIGESRVSRVGLGFDIHRLVAGRPLYLAGVLVQESPGLLGHSDGDVVLHAVIDALLGAAGLDDIGEHFPSDDPRLSGVSSSVLLDKTLDELSQRGLSVGQVDVNIIAETPRLGNEKRRLKENLARLLDLDGACVAVKARTVEGLGEIGAGNAIAAQAIAVLEERT